MLHDTTDRPLGPAACRDPRGTARDLPRTYDDMTTQTVQPLFAGNS